MWDVLDDRDSGVDEPADNEGVLGIDDSFEGVADVQMSPDGIPIVEPYMVSATPPFSPEHCPCLRGPCRYLWDVRAHFEHGNAPGTLEQQPRLRKLSCTAQPGVYMEMSSDAPVLECNLWDPLAPFDPASKAIEGRRQDYYARHPDHHPEAVAEAFERELAEAEAAAEQNEPTYEEAIGGTTAPATAAADDDGTDS